jgi:hypothetical protein
MTRCGYPNQQRVPDSRTATSRRLDNLLTTRELWERETRQEQQDRYLPLCRRVHQLGVLQAAAALSRDHITLLPGQRCAHDALSRLRTRNASDSASQHVIGL